jgi:hypothetical protein
MAQRTRTPYPHGRGQGVLGNVPRLMPALPLHMHIMPRELSGTSKRPWLAGWVHCTPFGVHCTPFGSWNLRGTLYPLRELESQNQHQISAPNLIHSFVHVVHNRQRGREPCSSEWQIPARGQQASSVLVEHHSLMEHQCDAAPAGAGLLRRPCTDAARAEAELTRAGTELIVSLAPATACRARRESPAHRRRRRLARGLAGGAAQKRNALPTTADAQAGQRGGRRLTGCLDACGCPKP